MPARKYPDELLDKAAALRERGMSCAAIARHLGMTTSSVSFHCLRLGADSPNTVGNIRAPEGPLVVTRGNHKVRRFTPDEDRQLIEMEGAGIRICDIARALHRPPNSIRGRLMTLARREARIEELCR